MRWLSILLLCLAGCGRGTDPSSPPPPQAISISWDFETGTLPNPPDNPNNVVPPVVLTETNGNHYGRLTVTSSDCRTPGDAVWDPCPRVREQVVIGTIPEVAGQTRTFSFKVRIPSAGQPAKGHDSILWQIVEPNATGTNQFHRSFWFGIHDFWAGDRFYWANRVPPVLGTARLSQETHQQTSPT